MALIKCPECTNQVSSIAASCPHCGAPVASSAGAGTPLATTQLTSKRLKIQLVFASLAFLGGLIWFWVACSSGDNEAPFVREEASFRTLWDWAFDIAPGAVILCLAGIAWGLVTRLRIWWHHK